MTARSPFLPHILTILYYTLSTSIVRTHGFPLRSNFIRAAANSHNAASSSFSTLRISPTTVSPSTTTASSSRTPKTNTMSHSPAITSSENVLATQRDKTAFLFRESVAPGLTIEMDLHRIMESTQSEFQQISVVDTFFGKTLITDGKTQSTQFDEFAYHESLVHPSLLNFFHQSGTKAKKVFIGGGGELATAREVLRHASVEKVVMVDLDHVVIDVSVKHLPEWGGEKVKNDPRLELIIGDAYKYLLETEEVFDVIIMDISDPIEAGPGIMLYTKELYEHAATRLSPHGLFVTQAGAADGIPLPHAMGNSQQDTTCFAPIRNTLAQVFDCVLPYTTSIPSFGSDWGFVMAFKVPDDKKAESAELSKQWAMLSPETTDGLIEETITGGEKVLGMYDGITHHRMFALTKAVRKQIAGDTRIMTKDNPVFMY